MPADEQSPFFCHVEAEKNDNFSKHVVPSKPLDPEGTISNYIGRDGRVCTWGWGRYGCLGHGNEECESVPKVVHVATGDYTTFVVCENGDVYSFGCGESSSLGHNNTAGPPDGQLKVSGNGCIQLSLVMTSIHVDDDRYRDLQLEIYPGTMGLSLYDLILECRFVSDVSSCCCYYCCNIPFVDCCCSAIFWALYASFSVYWWGGVPERMYRTNANE